MSHFLYVTSLVLAACWTLLYLGLEPAPAMIHWLIILAFFGIAASALLDHKKEILQNKHHN